MWRSDIKDLQNLKNHKMENYIHWDNIFLTNPQEPVLTKPISEFSCACGRSFERKCAMMTHIRCVHKYHSLLQLDGIFTWVTNNGDIVTCDNEKTFQCLSCETKFFTSKQRDTHVSRSHIHAMKMCPKCLIRFSRSDAYSRHMTTSKCSRS